MQGPFEMTILIFADGRPIRNRVVRSLCVRRGPQTEATRHDKYR
jgi:hypothetical protein